MSSASDSPRLEYAFGLGSNLGDRKRNLQRGRAGLERFDDASLIASSPLYETSPVDVAEDYRDCAFLNAVVIVESAAEPETWMDRIQQIEREAGRPEHYERNSPRTLDIDLLYAGEERRTGTALTLPHPRATERRFVLQPLADLRPDRLFPGTRTAVGKLLASLDDSETVTRLEETW